ncbi:ROK family protein [Pirellula staleyi DSM 6068]|uniref:ROK family protein n=1 Tax=Pirellula staleyi (strain ATCC 27377 / DSM 6068 / ICPB 4128) TaxID=530564 RepID=D2R829_PIRSD|nr:ROK family protein [Pirellula staleyi]ADB19360.1 ROK family protein [Pirellula staleyi DSM 6068]
MYETVSLDKAQQPLFLGFDVGGTNLKLGIVDDRGRVLARGSIPTNESAGPADAVRRAHSFVSEMLAKLGLKISDLAAVGLGTPGTLDIKAGRILEPHNLPHWFHFPIRECVSLAFGLPVSFANDANAAAYGEFWVGSGKAFHSMILLTLGTGVGGGIIIGDMSIDGENSHGSECGHIIIDCNPTARVCPCGQPGHLEGYCSATALVRRASELLSTGRDTSIRVRLDADEELSALLIAQEAEKGDLFSIELIDELAHYLAVGITSLMHTIDPGAVVLGGAMNFGGHQSPLGRRFLGSIRAGVTQYAFRIPAQRTTIDFAMLGGDAGFIGAAGIARVDHHKKRG